MTEHAQQFAPCPFCGGTDINPRAMTDCEREPDGDGAMPGCRSCGATAPSREAWNRRAYSTPMRLQRLEEDAAKACETEARAGRAMAQNDRLLEQNERLMTKCENLQQQAETHAQEARTANATIHEIYQLCTGATGEPGNWHGAEPVRRIVNELREAKKVLSDVRPEIDSLIKGLHHSHVNPSDGLVHDESAHDEIVQLEDLRERIIRLIGESGPPCPKHTKGNGPCYCRPPESGPSDTHRWTERDASGASMCADCGVDLDDDESANPCPARPAPEQTEDAKRDSYLNLAGRIINQRGGDNRDMDSNALDSFNEVMADFHELTGIDPNANPKVGQIRKALTASGVPEEVRRLTEELRDTAERRGTTNWKRGVWHAIDRLETVIVRPLASAPAVPKPDVYLESLTKAGQAKEGDQIIVRSKDGLRAECVVNVIRPGTEREEVVVSESDNRYFLTRLLIEGDSWAKAVFILREPDVGAPRGGD